jgi:hypothetical protein
VHGEDIPPPKGKGAPPIVVIGTTGDPATPYAWAERMAADLESAKLLTYRGEGHTGFGKGDACIDNAVVAYLLDGKVPDSGCGGAAKGLASLRSSAEQPGASSSAPFVRRLNIPR